MMIALQNSGSQQMNWNFSMSTFQFELVPLPNSVRNCYDCSQRFTNFYRHYSQNIIVQHRDQQIMGKSRFGDLAFSSDFQFLYYCVRLCSDYAVIKILTFKTIRMYTHLRRLLLKLIMILS